MPKPQAPLQSNVQGELISWNDLPDEYKNTPMIQADAQEPETPVSARSNNGKDQVFKAFANTTGTAFNIALQPTANVIDRIYLGHGAGVVTYLKIWYKRPDGSKYGYTLGGTGGQLVQRVFEAGEYIRSISGTSTGAITSLTIHTNKSVIGAGSVSGVSFSYKATIGSYIGSFSGGFSSASLNQLNVVSYFKPWEQIAGTNASDIALDTDGTAYMTGTNGKLYKMASTATAWSLVAGAPAGVVRVAAKVGKVAVVTGNGNVFHLQYNYWTGLPGNDARDVAVDGQGVVFKTTTTGNVKFYNQPGAVWWGSTLNINAKRITTGIHSVRIIHANGNIYSVGADVIRMPGTDGRDIATGDDNVVWLTNSAGKIYVLQYPTAAWKEIAGSDGNNIAAIPGKALLVNTVGKVYRMIH